MLWAITSYYNPAGYRRRRVNYSVFRARLGAPLLTVEWSPTGRFELNPNDADVLVQISGGSVLWQKERLLNIGVRRLPPEAEAVAWLDCDIVFRRADWARAAQEALRETRLVHLFERVLHLPRRSPTELLEADAWREDDPIHERPSTGFVFRRAVEAGDLSVFASPPAGQPFSNPASTGHAWAARRETLIRHPLFDAWVVGGGDTAYTYAAAGLAGEHVRMRGLTPAHARHYLPRAKALSEHVDGRLSYLKGDLLHLWHGESTDRRYQERFSILRAHGFDPDRDLVPSVGGAWEWREGLHAIAADVDEYFRTRFEDGRARHAQVQS